MIINNRKDLDAAPDDVRQLFIQNLEAGINRWDWQNGDWVLIQYTNTIRKFRFTLDDFPDAPVPEMPDYNPEERALEQARESASLSRADFKLALLGMGELDAVKQFIEQTNDQRIIIMWEDSSRFRRTHPDMLRLASEMGYTDEQMDALFGIEASAININTATADELETLSGVGASLAQQIIDGRPWAKVDDLASISGISQGMVDGWEVTV